MFKNHTKRYKYFEEQIYTTQNYVIPFIKDYVELDQNTEILEVGCGEGGNMKPFLDLGCKLTGVDLSAGKIENAKHFFQNHNNSKNLEFIHNDIYNLQVELKNKFDFIFLRDVLEHIHNQERFIKFIKTLLKPDGKLFLGFPPWQNPFGGHQQMCENKFLSLMPFIHILPNPIYVGLMKLFGESETKINMLLEIKETRISIERFLRIIKSEDLSVAKKLLFFINPNYEIKFKLKPRKQLNFLTSIPYLRNFLITTCYFLIEKND
ncbi:MAG: class I SAM-dependent methyltransferase [Bacteroidetes bacterium]|jgi:SAM-dependent methyltransferase|nr:class I SAM-dependent methyltransferase [Bacteroidota bacterium]MBT6686461.1 class I SAM-dependent methyltransferase [Bacteroidota bacterium]MBT7143568.1 class I SAM-dependent methyltransferase [Bacteroidota bacterium]MBT7491366.1 class I SAM-dependent methyltransferase [Bacteroidota bacterium]